MNVNEMIAICRMKEVSPDVWIPTSGPAAALRRVAGGWTFSSYVMGHPLRGDLITEKDVLHLLFCNSLPNDITMHCPCGECECSEKE